MPTVNPFKSDANLKFQSYSCQKEVQYTDTLTTNDRSGGHSYTILQNSNIFIGGQSSSMKFLNEVNSIYVDIDASSIETPLKLEMKYHSFNDIDNAPTKFTTEIAGGEIFHNSYPIAGRYVGINVENAESSNVTANCFVSYSKYGQYNTHAQSSDITNQFQMVNLNREVNDYNDDIVLGRFDDRVISNQHGFRSEWTDIEVPVVWGADEGLNLNNFYTEYYQQVHITSDDNTDTQNIVLQGVRSLLGVRNEGFTEEIVINGTSNVQTILDFRAVNKAYLGQNASVNSGNIYIRGAADGTLMNIIPMGECQSSSCVYSQPKESKSVIKQLQFIGTTGGSGIVGTLDIELRKVSGALDILLRKFSYDTEINIDTIIDINELLVVGEVVYCKVVNAHADTRINATIILRTYNIPL